MPESDPRYPLAVRGVSGSEAIHVIECRVCGTCVFTHATRSTELHVLIDGEIGDEQDWVARGDHARCGVCDLAHARAPELVQWVMRSLSHYERRMRDEKGGPT